MSPNTEITILLPQFTNEITGYPLNPLNRTGFLSGNPLLTTGVSSFSTALTNLTWSNNLTTWIANYAQYINTTATTTTTSSTTTDTTATNTNLGDYYATITLILTAGSHSMSFNQPFWIMIPSTNKIIPLCSAPINASKFTYSVTSENFYINSSTFTTTRGIGNGCRHDTELGSLIECNGRGTCDYGSGACQCEDGFGSLRDKEYLSNNETTNIFPYDCSGRACPVGPARFALYANYINYTAFPSQTGNFNPHRLLECSGNGACDRSQGVCKCYDGYTGSACERLQCPGDGSCSAQGEPVISLVN
jgi:hypothetical protein